VLRIELTKMKTFCVIHIRWLHDHNREKLDSSDKLYTPPWNSFAGHMLPITKMNHCKMCHLSDIVPQLCMKNHNVHTNVSYFKVQPQTSKCSFAQLNYILINYRCYSYVCNTKPMNGMCTCVCLSVCYSVKMP